MLLVSSFFNKISRDINNNAFGSDANHAYKSIAT